MPALSRLMTIISKHMRGCLLTLLLSLAGGMPFVALAQGTDARQLLEKMTEAYRTQNYEGVFVYRHDSRMDAMHIIHQANGSNERERMIALTGPAREVIRNNKSVTCIFPDDQAVLVEKSRPYKLPSAQLALSLEKLGENYAFTLAGEDRVAGHDAQIVAIQPRDRFRYGYRLWIDKDSHLLLRSELIGEQGKPLEQFMFTRLEIREQIPDSKLEPSITGTDYTWYENSDDLHNDSVDDNWQVGWLPNGFSITNRSDELLADSPRPVKHLVFTDGLAMVSVFVEKISGDSGILIGPSKRGAVNAFAREADGHQVMVVGEVPLITARQVANSVSYTP